jgi:hypothetical protein
LVGFIQNHPLPVLAAFVITVVSGLITIIEVVFPGPDIKQVVSAVTRPDQRDTQEGLRKIDMDMSNKIDELSQSLTAGPLKNQPLAGQLGQGALSSTLSGAPLPLGPTVSPKIIGAIPPASTAKDDPCVRTSPTAILYDLSVTVAGDPELSSSDIRQSIEAHMPSTLVYASGRPECTQLHIIAEVTITEYPKTIGGMSAEGLAAVAQLSFSSIGKIATQVVHGNFSKDFVDEDFSSNPVWPKKWVVCKSVENALADRRIVQFVSTHFGLILSGPVTAESSVSLCGAG